MNVQSARQSASVSWGSPQPDTDQKTFVCLGVPRGGTSAIAGVMRKLGIFMGENVPNNHEDPEFISKPNPHRLSMIEKRNSAHSIWGWKDPNAVNYLHQIAPKLRNPHFVIVSRDVIATTKGHMRWHGREVKFAVGDVALQQQRNVFFALSGDAPVLFVSYEKAILNPTALVAEMAEFLGFPYPADDKPFIDFLAPGSYKDV